MDRSDETLSPIGPESCRVMAGGNRETNEGSGARGLCYVHYSWTPYCERMRDVSSLEVIICRRARGSRSARSVTDAVIFLFLSEAAQTYKTRSMIQ